MRGRKGSDGWLAGSVCYCLRIDFTVRSSLGLDNMYAVAHLGVKPAVERLGGKAALCLSFLPEVPTVFTLTGETLGDDNGMSFARKVIRSVVRGRGKLMGHPVYDQGPVRRVWVSRQVESSLCLLDGLVDRRKTVMHGEPVMRVTLRK